MEGQSESVRFFRQAGDASCIWHVSPVGWERVRDKDHLAPLRVILESRLPLFL